MNINRKNIHLLSVTSTTSSSRHIRLSRSFNSWIWIIIRNRINEERELRKINMQTSNWSSLSCWKAEKTVLADKKKQFIANLQQLKVHTMLDKSAWALKMIRPVTIENRIAFKKMRFASIHCTHVGYESFWTHSIQLSRKRSLHNFKLYIFCMHE